MSAKRLFHYGAAYGYRTPRETRDAIPPQVLGRSMDHYIPKRRVPVTLWSLAAQAVQGQLFLDLDAATKRHQTILEKLNESGSFLPLAVGEEGRACLFNKAMVARVTAGRQVIQTDVYARGFLPWREEEAELLFGDGATLSGRIWMPLHRESQRISDFMNLQGAGFFVLTTHTGIHLVNAAAVLRIMLSESAGAPLTGPAEDAIAR